MKKSHRVDNALHEQCDQARLQAPDANEVTNILVKKNTLI